MKLTFLERHRSMTESGKKLPKIPTLYGGNFQAVSVAQKTVGYANATGNPFSAEILKALDFVDSSLGQVISAMKKAGIYEDSEWTDFRHVRRLQMADFQLQPYLWLPLSMVRHPSSAPSFARSTPKLF